MFAELQGWRGEVSIDLVNRKTGKKRNAFIKNLVVDTGLAFVTQRLIDNTVLPMSHMGIGTNGVATTKNQTTLGAEVGTRVALMSTTAVQTVVAKDSVQYIAMFPDGNPAVLTALTEAGLFNAAVAGVMMARTTFPVINKDVDDSMTITWKVIQTAVVA